MVLFGFDSYTDIRHGSLRLDISHYGDALRVGCDLPLTLYQGVWEFCLENFSVLRE